MSCDYKNPMEVRNAIENKEQVYPVAETSADIDSFIKHSKQSVKTTEDKEFYTVEGVGQLQRSSSLAHKIIKDKNARHDKGKSDTVQSLGGTLMHEIIANYLEVLNGKIPKEDFNKLVTESKLKAGFNLNDEQLGKLLNFIEKEIYQKAVERQKQIDPNANFFLYVETPIFDPLKNVGGTLDLLIVYSNMMADKFDWKFTSPQKKHLNKAGEVESDFFLYGSQLKYFRTQGSIYKNALLKNYSIKGFYRDVVVPFHIEYEYYEGKPTRSIKKISTRFQSDSLSDILIGSQKTGSKSVDKLLSDYGKLAAYYEQLAYDTSIPEGERTKLRSKLARIKRSISLLTSSLDTSLLVKHVQDLIEYYEAVKDEASYDIISALATEASVYAEMASGLADYIETQIEDEEAKKEAKTNLRLVSYEANKLETQLRNHTYDKVVDELVDDEFKNEKGEILPYVEDDFLVKYMGRMGEFNSPYFKTAKQIIEEKLFGQKHFKNKALYEQLMLLQEQIKKAGISKEQLKDLLFNKNSKTKNFYTEMKPEFYEKLNNAFEGKDDQFLKEIFEVSPNYQKMIDQLEKDQEEYWTNHYKIRGYTDAELKKLVKREVSKWEENNKLYVNGKINPKAWKTDYYKGRKYLQINPKIKKNYYSEEYKKIAAIEPVEKLYQLAKNMMVEARLTLGLDQDQRLPYNFFPWIRKKSIERMEDMGLFKGGFANFGNFFSNMAIREDDTIYGMENEFGHKTIPVFFTNEFRNDKGEIDDSDRSYDIFKSLFLFGDMMHQHQFAKQIEPEILALREAMLNKQETQLLQINRKGQIAEDIHGDEAKMTLNKGNDLVKAYNDFVDFYIYGINVQEQGRDFKLFGKEINSTKALQVIKRKGTELNLAFSVVGSAASYLSARANLSFIKTKNMAVTSEHLNSVQKLMVGMGDSQERKKLAAAIEYFQPTTETFAEQKMYSSSSYTLQKRVNERLMFWGYRKGSELIDHLIAGAMLKNYAWHEGKLIRLNNPAYKGQNIKSLFDIIKYDGENISFEGIDEKESLKVFARFRSAVREINQDVKGEISQEDILRAQTHIIGQLMLNYKSWMPGIIKEHFGKLRKNTITDTVDWGRWRAHFNDYEYQEGQGFIEYTKKVLLPRITKNIIDIATFGVLSSDIDGISKRRSLNLFSRYNEQQLREQFSKIKQQNPQLANLTFEEYKEIKIAQVRSALAEIRAIAMLIGLIAFAGGAGDDDEPFYKQNKFARIMFKIANKTKQELGFALDPTEGGYLFRNPIPVLGVVVQFKRALQNTFDEVRDMTVGENSKQDKTPLGYYSLFFVRGYNQLKHILEFYEQNKSVTGYSN